MTITATGLQLTDHWTIAVRKPTARTFRRVTDWSGDWDMAADLGRFISQLHEGLQVWVIPTAISEANGFVCDEDMANVLVPSGKRIKVVESGVIADLLPEPVEPDPIDMVQVSEIHGDGVTLALYSWTVAEGPTVNFHRVRNTTTGVWVTEELNVAGVIRFLKENGYLISRGPADVLYGNVYEITGS